jgi:DNA-binding MarR family transcriptional regulator
VANQYTVRDASVPVLNVTDRDVQVAVRYLEGESPKELAKAFDVTASYISQLVDKVVARVDPEIYLIVRSTTKFREFRDTIFCSLGKTLLYRAQRGKKVRVSRRIGVSYL